MWPNPQETADLVTLTEEILNDKLEFLCSEGPDYLHFWVKFSITNVVLRVSGRKTANFFLAGFFILASK